MLALESEHQGLDRLPVGEQVLHVRDLPQQNRRWVPGPLRQRWRSRRNGLRLLFRHGDSVYKTYDPDFPTAVRRSRGIAKSFPLVAELARAIDQVVPMTGLIVDGPADCEQVVGYWMPYVAGRPIRGATRLAATRDLFVRIDTWLVERGHHWRDPKLSNFRWDAANREPRVVDPKHVVPLERGRFDPDRQRNAPRSQKLEALGLDAADIRDMEARRRAYWRQA